MRLLRWADRLNEYRFDDKFKPGEENVVADLLSRATTEKNTEHDNSARDDSELSDIRHFFIYTVFGN